ncbi:hypothetical protein ONZ45_g3404 [Pleurotus djamor]|nr:hypothetical protein ONZ45_g3404 [Pleurotus djamor]
MTSSVVPNLPLPSYKRSAPSSDEDSAPSSKRRKAKLQIDIPDFTVQSHYTSLDTDDLPDTKNESLFTPSSESSESSLFLDESVSTSTGTSLSADEASVIATRCGPPIPGLYFNPSIEIPEDLADRVMKKCMETYFTSPDVNQVMLFGRTPTKESPSSSPFPPILDELLASLANTLSPYLPGTLSELLFPAVPERARQAIINLYYPGEGISKHVDLLRRFGDGIIGVSFGSGCVMQFDRLVREDSSSTHETYQETPEKSYLASSKDANDRHDLYLPERSVIVLSGDARYKWTHGIEKRLEDAVEGATIARGTRMSITFRWLLPGAEILGGDAPSP